MGCAGVPNAGEEEGIGLDCATLVVADIGFAMMCIGSTESIGHCLVEWIYNAGKLARRVGYAT